MTTAHPFDPVLPGSDLTRSLTAAVLAAESAAIANHSIRTFFFARLLATHLHATPGRDYDEQLLFAACVLHDIGLTSAADGEQRFEVDGADHAAGILRGHGMSSSDVEAVWDAIALHTSGGIAERRSLLCRLTRGGVGLDLGLGAEFVTTEQAEAIHLAYPRLDVEKALADTIIEQVKRNPAKAPRYSIADGLVAERVAPPHRTRMEQGAAAAHWGTDAP